MDAVQKFISENQHQLGYIMQEASRLWIAKDKFGALTVGACNVLVEKHGEYHEILEKLERYEEALKFYATETTHESPVNKDNGETARKALGRNSTI